MSLSAASQNLRHTPFHDIHAALGAKLVPFTGYEIHMGLSRGPALERPALLVDGSPDGVISDDDRILATYVHGLFDRVEARRALMAWAGCARQSGPDLDERREASLERLADHAEKALDLRRLLPMFAAA